MSEKIYTYETIMILDPTLDEKDREEFLNDIGRLFISHSDVPVHMSEWGKKKLAYPVKKHMEGYYVHFYHHDTESGAKILQDTFDTLSSRIIKFIVVKQADDYERDWSRPPEGYHVLIDLKTDPKVNKHAVPDAYDVILGLAKY